MCLCLSTLSLYFKIDICCPRPTAAANPPVAAAAVNRRDRQIDGRTFDRFMTLTAYRADRIINILLFVNSTSYKNYRNRYIEVSLN